LFRLLTSGKGSSTQKPPLKTPKSALNDILVEDPVCHTYIPQKEAETLVFDGKTYYFCSKKCLNSFQEDKKRS
jgi:YHS domain-containing protein